MSQKIHDLPTENNEDFAHKALKGMFGVIPGGGGVISELFEIVIGPSIEKRRNLWLLQLAEMLEELEVRTNFNRLQHNQEFVSLFLKLTQAAYRTHQNEKLDYFRKILKNSIIRDDISFDVQFVISSFIEDNTVSHLLITKYIYEHQDDVKSLDSFEKHYNYFCKTYRITTEMTFGEFTFYCRSLELQRILKISNLIVDDSEGEISSSNWLTSNNTNPQAPYIILTKMGLTTIKYIEG